MAAFNMNIICNCIYCTLTFERYDESINCFSAVVDFLPPAVQHLALCLLQFRSLPFLDPVPIQAINLYYLNAYAAKC